MAWESIQENINISAKESLDYYELKQFDKKMSRTIRSEKTKLQDSSQMNRDNLTM
jgi:hypothetical protein